MCKRGFIDAFKKVTVAAWHQSIMYVRYRYYIIYQMVHILDFYSLWAMSIGRNVYNVIDHIQNWITRMIKGLFNKIFSISHVGNGGRAECQVHDKCIENGTEREAKQMVIWWGMWNRFEQWFSERIQYYAYPQFNSNAMNSLTNLIFPKITQHGAQERSKTLTYNVFVESKCCGDFWQNNLNMNSNFFFENVRINGLKRSANCQS